MVWIPRTSVHLDESVIPFGKTSLDPMHIRLWSERRRRNGRGRQGKGTRPGAEHPSLCLPGSGDFCQRGRLSPGVLLSHRVSVTDSLSHSLYFLPRTAFLLALEASILSTSPGTSTPCTRSSSHFLKTRQENG